MELAYLFLLLNSACLLFYYLRINNWTLEYPRHLRACPYLIWTERRNWFFSFLERHIHQFIHMYLSILLNQEWASGKSTKSRYIREMSSYHIMRTAGSNPKIDAKSGKNWSHAFQVDRHSLYQQLMVKKIFFYLQVFYNQFSYWEFWVSSSGLCSDMTSYL